MGQEQQIDQERHVGQGQHMGQGQGRHMDRLSAVSWQEAAWLNEPRRTGLDGTDLLVTARARSDFWRTTSYGFVRDDGHALLRAFPQDRATEEGLEVRFTGFARGPADAALHLP
ncbi:DUF1349 domain-containing protein [Streptomyces sp. NPDC059010]|uniref:DUF1349 domain-containing protein n=1 Tax=Streptomyces sp. NPDC059010 TaxID=3346695 RepID=UPI0036A6B9A7